MTIYTKITSNGTEIEKFPNINVSKSISTNGAASTFSASIDNFAGRNTGSFVLGDAIDIYADKDINPPTTKIFAGLLENVSYAGKELKDKIKITGRDYTARLMDRTVEPQVYINLPCGSIVKDIVAKYVDDITTTNVSDGPIVIERIAYAQTPTYDAIDKLAKIDNYNFYIDTDKDLHFEEKSTVSSNITFDSGNVLSTSINSRRDTIFNEAWVYGGQYLDAYTETYTGDGTGSVFTTTYDIHNSNVTLDGVQQVGAVFGMNIVPPSGTNYMINFYGKHIIFVSGTLLGYDNIPGAGSEIIVTYDRPLPVVKFGQNPSSISQYGKRVKVEVDKGINDPTTAQRLVSSILDEESEPAKQGTLKIKGVCNVTPSQTCVVNLPHVGVTNQTYDIIGAKYNFSKETNLAEQVLSVKVNKKIDDVTDTIKYLLNQVKDLHSDDISKPEISTNVQYTTGSFGIRQSGCAIYTRNITGSAMIWNNPAFAIWGTDKWGTEGSAFTDRTIQWSGCYF